MPLELFEPSTYSEIKIAGGKKVTKKLRIPRKRRGFYSDIVVLAFPVRKENETNELITDLNLKLGFRISGKQPELWDALTGEIRHALAFSHNDGMTTVPLTL